MVWCIHTYMMFTYQHFTDITIYLLQKLPAKYKQSFQDKALMRVQLGNFIEGKSSDPQTSWSEYKLTYETLAEKSPIDKEQSATWESSGEESDKVFP